jgi:hypothetical protein
MFILLLLLLLLKNGFTQYLNLKCELQKFGLVFVKRKKKIGLVVKIFEDK